MMTIEKKHLTLYTIDDMILKLTQNDIINLENQAFSVYQDLQATLAGQSMSDVDTLENNFNEIADDLGVSSEDLWEQMECFHEQYINR